MLYFCCTLDMSADKILDSGRLKRQEFAEGFTWLLLLFPLFVASDSYQSLVLPPAVTNEETEAPFDHLPQVNLEV